MSDKLAEDQNQLAHTPAGHDSPGRRPSTAPSEPKRADDRARPISEHRRGLRFISAQEVNRAKRLRSERRRRVGNAMLIGHDDLDLLRTALDIFGNALTLVLLTGQREQRERPNLSLAVSALSDQHNANSLRMAVDIARELLRVEAKSTVQAWFVGQNPMLDDRAPALIVRTNPDAVREAAKHFVAYG